MSTAYEELLEIEAIRQLKYRYVRALDTADMEGLRACMTEDAYIKFEGGLYTVEYTGIEKILDFLSSSFHSKAAASHQVHHPTIEITSATTARGQWSLSDVFHDLNHRIIVAGAAEYVDDYIKDESGDWRIARSGYTRLYEMTQPMPAEMNCTFNKLAQTGKELG